MFHTVHRPVELPLAGVDSHVVLQWKEPLSTVCVCIQQDWQVIKRFYQLKVDADELG